MTRETGRGGFVSRPNTLSTRDVRDRALLDLGDGPVTPSNRADLVALARLLNVLLASLLVSSLQYEQHAVHLRAPSHRSLAEFLQAGADSDRLGARRLATRIRQLGFAPDHDPQHLAARSRIAYRTYPEGDITGIVTEQLVAARILVQTLQEAVRWVGELDPTTRRLLERILEEKEAQADALSAQSPAPSPPEAAEAEPPDRPRAHP